MPVSRCAGKDSDQATVTAHVTNGNALTAHLPNRFYRLTGSPAHRLTNRGSVSVFICVDLWFLMTMLAQGTIEAFRLQSEFCAKFGSPLYAELLARAADDIERGGPIARVLDGWTGNPVPDALVLRLMGAVHQLVLNGAAPELGRHYPSVGGEPESPAVWDAFLEIVETHHATVRTALDRQVQT